MLKKLLKVLFYGLALLMVVAVIGYFVVDKPQPKGQAGPAAEQLADRMLAAVNRPAFDSTRYISWRFRGDHTYLWDKQQHIIRVQWGGRTAFIVPNQNRGQVYEAGAALQGEQNALLVAKAFDLYNNDSFWLIAPHKVKDPGTERSIVALDDGTEALMVTYTSGGSTPGDSYLWKLASDGKPTAFQMWVSIIPAGGLEFTWEDWQQTETGFWVATKHEGSILSVPIFDLKTGMTLQELGEDPAVFDDVL